MSNSSAFEQFTSTQKINADVLLTLIRSACNGLERLTALNMTAARDFLNVAVANTQKILDVKDVSELSRLNLSQPSLEKWLDYSRNVHDLATSLQKELTSVAEGQYEQLSRTANATLDKTKNAPGGDVLTATVKSFMDGYGRAFEQISQMSKQASALTEANMQAVANATKAAIGKK
ncbi:MAG: phasin family protein [Zoogloeaceae bacterium]|jgi:phasin family protein|nr:phasin family protein [Zoogloeaceae bacterium]